MCKVAIENGTEINTVLASVKETTEKQIKIM